MAPQLTPTQWMLFNELHEWSEFIWSVTPSFFFFKKLKWCIVFICTHITSRRLIKVSKFSHKYGISVPFCLKVFLRFWATVQTSTQPHTTSDKLYSEFDIVWFMIHAGFHWQLFNTSFLFPQTHPVFKLDCKAWFSGQIPPIFISANTKMCILSLNSSL